MPLKLTCPHCGKPTALDEPLPLPGTEVRCTTCAQGLAVTYPAGVIEKLRAKGKVFQSEDEALAKIAPLPKAKPPAAPKAAAPKSSPTPAPKTSTRVAGARPVGEAGTSVPTSVDPTMVAEPTDGHFDRTVRSGRDPWGNLPSGAGGPEGELDERGDDDALAVTELDGGPTARPLVASTEADARRGKRGEEATVVRPRRSEEKTQVVSARASKKAAAAPARRLGCFGRLVVFGLLGGILSGIVGGGVAGAAFWHYSQDLPSIEFLQAYEPPTVTMVYDHEGQLLGEIYEQRRYVVPLETIPSHVKQAFIAAEDANFYEHGGVDYGGILRAMARNARQGRMAQGASTITQQVTRNFLLTKDKKIERKIKEVILSWRIEEAYDKEHILYLYLNEIYLGSGSYGVEAASRVYFDKHVADITLAEAAILAGLPQRPSDYSPHRHFPKAKERQRYVLDQMVRNAFITQAEADAALAEEVKIVEKTNEFLDKAPHFTEYARRHLVETYGHEKVYNEGLIVRTTCDLDLQRVAQTALTAGVDDTDQRMGFRREAIVHLASDAEIATKRAAYEKELREGWAKEQDPAGRVPVPEKSVLVPGKVYQGVLLEVKPKWARVAIGDHEGVIPIAWADWAYEPNPARSWRYRTQTDLTEKVDTNGDRVPDAGILQKGDVVKVRLEGPSTQDPAHAKVFAGTPGADADQLAVRLWQDPEVESALLSFDLHTGAVRAMVGGANYAKSEFNRAVQSKRQVGSTFKPIVYAAAIDSKRITPASIVTDGPLAFSTDQDFIWKPANYGDDYLGNISLRQALALSRNTCTVRVLESIDPGMNNDVVYKFARAVGIGGPPTHELPADWVPKPDNDHLCPWVLEKPESTICMDRYPPKDPNISNTRHRAQMKPGDEYWCRACDLSMGLGSASLTMEELLRAYSAFPSGGKLVEPYYIEEVKDRKGNVLEAHAPTEFAQVVDPAVASITTWLLEGVVQGGTAAAAQKLGVHVGGKTGTTNDEKDAWFVGFTNDVITGVWVGFDTPKPLGVSSTGGRTALPVWMEYMKVAAPKESDRPFPMRGDIEWAQIDEKTGRRVSSGGRSYPFLKDTVPEASGLAAGQATTEDLITDL